MADNIHTAQSGIVCNDMVSLHHMLIEVEKNNKSSIYYKKKIKAELQLIETGFKYILMGFTQSYFLDVFEDFTIKHLV